MTLSRHATRLAAGAAAAALMAAGSTGAIAGTVYSGGLHNGSLQTATNLVRQATQEVQQMKRDPGMRQILARAQGIYLVPHFGRGAFIVGGEGGSGLAVFRKGDGWTAPAFYNFGGISIGAQAGGSGGEVAYILMTPKAVNNFRSGNKISVNAKAGLAVVNYSANTKAQSDADVVMWSNTSGLYGGATVGGTDINWDNSDNQAFYGKNVNMQAVLNGKVMNTRAAPLEEALKSIS